MIEFIIHRYKIKKFEDQRIMIELIPRFKIKKFKHQRIMIELIHRYKIKKFIDERIVSGLIVYLYKSKELYHQWIFNTKYGVQKYGYLTMENH